MKSIIECYKDFHLYAISYFPQLIQESGPIEKKTLDKRSEFSLIRADKIGKIMTLGQILTFGIDLVMMPDKRKGYILFVSLHVSQVYTEMFYSSPKDVETVEWF